MCGRYTIKTSTDELADRFEAEARKEGVFLPQFNAAPTQDLPVVLPADEGRKLELYRWGLIPSWAKDASIGNRMINARGETMAEKPSFRAAFKRRRCLAPFDGFFEWKKTEGGKIPHYITLTDGKPFAVAGLWETWRDKSNPDGKAVKSFTVVTRQPNEFMVLIHDRMPLILLPEEEELWLDPDSAPEALMGLVERTFPSELMTAWEVSTQVNNPRNNHEAIIDPVEI